jgi:hypothetical protein
MLMLVFWVDLQTDQGFGSNWKGRGRKLLLSYLRYSLDNCVEGLKRIRNPQSPGRDLNPELPNKQKVC